MSLRILLLLFTFCIGISTYGQWQVIQSGTSIELTSVHFPTDSVGYTVGGKFNRSIILKSLNAGLSWFRIDSSILTSEKFQVVRFVNKDSGIVISDTVIYSTENGGINWVDRSIPHLTNHNLILVEDYMYLVGSSSKYDTEIYRSKDLAGTWDTVLVSNSYVIRNVHFIDSLIGFGSGEYGNFNHIYKSVDGGASWYIVNFPSYNFCVIEKIHFLDTLNGFTCGWSANHLMKTSDGGNTWQKLKLDSTQTPKMPATYSIGSRDSIVFIGGSYLYSSNDFGVNWRIEDISDSINGFYPQGLNDIDIFSSTKAVGVGYNGTIIQWDIDTAKIDTTYVEEINDNNISNVKVYPNPSRGSFNLVSPKNIQILSIEISAADGRLLYQDVNPSNTIQHDLGNNYIVFVKIMTNTGVETHKVLIE